MTPRQVDDMEVWQVASILDIEPAPVGEDMMDFGRAGQRPLTEADKRRLEKFGMVAQGDVDITESVMRQMGIRTS